MLWEASSTATESSNTDVHLRYTVHTLYRGVTGDGNLLCVRTNEARHM